MSKEIDSIILFECTLFEKWKAEWRDGCQNEQKRIFQHALVRII